MSLRDDSGIVLAWVVKIFVVLSVLGLVLYEIGAITFNYFGLATSADDIAIAVSSQQDGLSANKAELKEQVRIRAKTVGAKVVSVKLHQQDQSLTIVLARKASTLIIDEIPSIKGWAKATATGKSGTE